MIHIDTLNDIYNLRNKRDFALRGLEVAKNSKKGDVTIRTDLEGYPMSGITISKDRLVDALSNALMDIEGELLQKGICCK